MRAILPGQLVFILAALLLSVTRAARADTLEAPVGGAAFPLGEGRVACARNAAGWTVDPTGRTVHPPALVSAAGSSVDLRVAASAADCAQSTATVRLTATAPWPKLDPASFTLAVDEGRLAGQGRGLSGVIVSWPAEQGLGSDACRDVKPAGSSEACTWGVPKTLPADPAASVLRWWPAGAVVAADAVLFNADGKRAAPETFTIAPARVEVLDLLPPNASVDVSSGVGRAALIHPDVIAAVDCGALRCTTEAGALVVLAPPAAVNAVDVKFRLVPHVYDVRKSPPEAQPTLHLAILRCPMTIASGPPLRGVDGARAVVRIEGACMKDAAALTFLAGTQRVEVAQIVNAPNAAYAVLELATVRGPEVSIAAVRGEGEGTVVAMARSETRAPPVVHTSIEITGFPPIDFLPNNRTAIVHVPHVAGAELALLSVPDVYEATNEHGVTTVQGDVDAVGLVTLQFGYRAPSLPPPLDAVNLAVLSDALQRSVKEASIPAPFGLTADSKSALVEILCTDDKGVTRRLVAGVPMHLPFTARYGCRVVLHRERLAREYGTQKLALDIEVDKVDGAPRPDAHVNQTIILRAGSEPRVAWIKGIAAPYDRLVVRLSHLADEALYLGALEIASGEPAVQWAAVFGTGHVRMYATTAIPTGLYRVSTPETSSVVSLSVAILSRLTWLDSEGHEGLLGIEAGLMAFGFTATTPTATLSETQAGLVVGLGLSIPIANAGAPTQASINLHAWYEERVVGSGDPVEAASRHGVIFGPSISLGNVGATF